MVERFATCPEMVEGNYFAEFAEVSE